MEWVTAADDFYFYYTINGGDILSKTWSWTPTIETWYHIAVMRTVNDVELYIDGVGQGAQGLGAITISDGSATGLWLGSQHDGGGTYDLDGYMDEVRISKGVSRWSDDFTPPAKAYCD